MPGSSRIKVSIQELLLPLQSIGICCMSTMGQALFLRLDELVTNAKKKISLFLLFQLNPSVEPR